MANSRPKEAWRQRLDEGQQACIQELIEFLRIPSISALPDRRSDIAAAAEWVNRRLHRAGIENVATFGLGSGETRSSVVYGDWMHADAAPTVMIYGHFDVQPAQSSDGWTTPPFEPRLEDGRLYARGASDDKGNMFAPILAVEAVLAASGELPINVKFMFEGQEEIGSPDLEPFIEAHKEMLRADFVLAADGGQWSETEPQLTLSHRGLCGLEIVVRGPGSDLHSGLYGGTVQNPIHALCILLSGFHDSDGRVAISGFYDQVTTPSTQQRAAFARVPFHEQDHLNATGAPALYGEARWTTHEREWVRPTLELNGVWGGFQGAGTKTVLPATAHAKVTCRLVANQDPRAVLKLVQQHIDSHAPAGVTTECLPAAAFGDPYTIPADHPGNAAAAAVLRASYGRESYHVGSGGTLPICGMFLTHLGTYTVPFSFGLDDEGAHGPDEFFRLASFRRAQDAFGDVLFEFGR